MSVTPEGRAIITGRNSIAMARDDTNPDYNRMMRDLILELYGNLRKLNPTMLVWQKYQCGFFHIICIIGNLKLHYFIRLIKNATMKDLLTCMHGSASKLAINTMTDYVSRLKPHAFKSLDLINTGEQYYHIES